MTVQTFYVIPCSGAKRALAAPAGDIYLGSFHRLARRTADALADRHGGQVLIMSALHGLLDLATVIEPYNVTVSGLAKRGGPGHGDLSRRCGDQLAALGARHLVGLLPRLYWEVLETGMVLSGHGAVREWVLADCPGIGYQQQRLVALRDGRIPLTA